MPPLSDTSAPLDPAIALEAFRAAGEETRLRILGLLRECELTVSDLCRILGQSQPRVSRHLKVLVEADLIERHREGVWTVFSLARRSPAIRAVETALTAIQYQLITRYGDADRLQEITAERELRARSYLQENADRWSAERALYVDEHGVEQAMLDVVGGAPIGTLIDLGTGGGRMLELFADRIEDGVGIDVSSEMLSYARTRLQGQRRLRVRLGDFFNLGDLARSADLAVMHQVLRFMSDPAAAIRAASRALLPNGRLLIVDFALHERAELIERCGHARLGFSDADVETWLDASGMQLEDRRRLDPTDPSGEELPVSIWLARRLTAQPAASSRLPDAAGVAQIAHNRL